MKRSTFFKIILSGAFMMFVFEMFAQNAPYSQMTATSPKGSETTDSITVGSTVMYFVEPDAVLNNLTGDYDTTGSAASQGVTSKFGWSIDASGSAVFTIDDDINGEDSIPVVLVTAVTAGTPDSLIVEEVSVAGCTGSNTTAVGIEIFAQPAFVVGAVADTYQICAGTFNVQVASITDNSINQAGNLLFQVDSAAWQDVPPSDLTAGVAVGAKTGTDAYLSISETNLGGTGVTVFSRYLSVVSGITRYEYTFDGMNDHISRKSDFLILTTKDGSDDSEYTYYAPTTGGGNHEKIVVLVYPSPTTGTIYYIPNNFNL